MKQILQSFKSGKTELVDIPVPTIGKGQVLIQTSRSLVSTGTERMLVEFGKSSLVQKARQQPDKVKLVLDKIKAEGLLPTIENVFSRLEQPIPLGYCNVGRVIDIGQGVSEFKIGDRVVSNGPHAEYVAVPKNLVAHIPENVSDEEATFTVIGSIGLEGIRLLNPTIGETVVIIGLGLIGLITSEMLMANGCRVIGYDLDQQKVELALQKGINAFNPTKGNDPVNFVLSQTNGIGADGVIITAYAKTNTIISDAAKMSRKRGRIILVGVIGLSLSRADFYEKELSFQVSCSYGPGRYDENYEYKGQDYPLPYVRWTAKRNFETILEALSTKKIDVNPLITEVVKLDDYLKIYENIGNSNTIASILKYDENSEPNTVVKVSPKPLEGSKGVVGIIGAGNYTKMTLLPALKDSGAILKYIASAGGVNSTELAKKYQISESTTDYKTILDDDQVDLVIITTRHNLHATLVMEVLAKNKHVFVEKPLAIKDGELSKIEEVYRKSQGTLSVGFNRRFSTHTQKIKSLLGDSPMNIIATMNAGFIPSNVWVHDMEIGGGRIIGEACHYMDLIVFLTGSKITSVCMNSMGVNPAENTDNASILLKMENGSTGVINYFANGSKAYAKERIEIYAQERTLILDNFRITKAYGFKGFKKLKTKIDKGHKTQFHRLISNIQKGDAELIPFDQVVNVTKASFAAIESLKQNGWVKVN